MKNSPQQKNRNENLESQNKGQNKNNQPQGISSKKGNWKVRKDTRKWCKFHKISLQITNECFSKW